MHMQRKDGTPAKPDRALSMCILPYIRTAPCPMARWGSGVENITGYYKISAGMAGTVRYAVNIMCGVYDVSRQKYIEWHGNAQTTSMMV